MVNEGEIKATKKVLRDKRGYLLEFQEGREKYLLQPNTNDTGTNDTGTNDTGVSIKVKNTTLNFLVILLLS